MRLILSIIFFSAYLFGFSQEKIEEIIIKGKVLDENNKPVQDVTIGIIGGFGATVSDESGNYTFSIKPKANQVLSFSHINYVSQTFLLNIKESKELTYNVKLKRKINEFKAIEIGAEYSRFNAMSRINPKKTQELPSAVGGVEALIKTMAGVTSNNELSSQYSVRGGNYDENLVYVNDIEIYRPFLIRSGEQEGLSFINSDMTESIQFSAGGFEARYGDKMSSVLDIQYRKPKSFGGNFSGSILGGSAHVEGVGMAEDKLSYQIGLRHKSNAYLLNSLNTKGSYRPSFSDIQTFITYNFNKRWEINYLGNFSRNKYLVIPENRTTEFGHVNEALRFTVYFDGKEMMDYSTFMNALVGIYRPNSNVTLKLIGSYFTTNENEAFDVQGQYRLDELEKDLSSENFGGVSYNRGIGTYINHARNELKASVINLEHKGYFAPNANTFMQWGLKFQTEIIDDKLSEWKMLDSAGYSVPFGNPLEINLQNVLKTKVGLQTNRGQAYVQNAWEFGDSTLYNLTIGARAHYWDFSNQFVASPRITFSMKPNWKRDWVFRIASGFYYQPPFYRELRNLKGEINKEIKAQQSVHFVGGADYNFTMLKRPFKMVIESYYKILNNLIPYDIDNVRLRYFATNNSNGYATGLDFKLNGEFVKGIESWFSLSIMETKENLNNDYYYRYFNSDGNLIVPGFTANSAPTDSIRFEPGFIPRLSDQKVTISIVFQDYLPRNPDFKVNLGMYYGTGLPFGPPTQQRYQATRRLPAYFRADIGFSYQILKEERTYKKQNFFNNIDNLWVSLEVFNLLGISNTLNYTWIKDVNNRLYAVPNYLTQRLINVKLVGKF